MLNHVLRTRLVVTALCLGSLSSSAFAQSGSGDGYLFQAPHANLSLRFGVARPDARSNVFSQVTNDLTLNRGSFAGVSAAVDLDVAITQRVALQFGLGMSSRDVTSEYRDYVDNQDLPIEQTTSFRRAPLTAGLKVYLLPPGRSLGRLAWVPNRFAPYVSGGGGLMYHRFRQSGDFVDFRDFDVFSSTVETDGWTASAYGAAGMHYSLSSRLGLTTEARYDRARAPMGRDFVGFDRINLSGVSVTTGLNLRF
jgi:hypothetical protein